MVELKYTTFDSLKVLILFVEEFGILMKVRIKKFGIASEANIRQDSTAEVVLDRDSIIMNSAAKEISLDDLLSRIATENLHGEVDFGKAKGKEVW